MTDPSRTGGRHLPEDLRFAILADEGHPLHGAIIELVRPLVPLHSMLAARVQGGTTQILAPVHASDAVDYLWPKLSSVGPEEWPTCAVVSTGSVHGLAAPRVMFTALSELAQTVPSMRQFVASNAFEADSTALHVQLGPGGLHIDVATVPNLLCLAARSLEAAQSGGQPCLALTWDLTTQSAYFGSPPDALRQQLAANKWLALRTLCERLKAGAPTSASGEAAVYAFVEHADAGLVQGAAFVLPRVRAPGVRVGRPARVVGLASRPELNGQVVTALRCSGLGGEDAGWCAVARNPAVVVDRWAVLSPAGDTIRLRPVCLEAV